MLINDLIKLPHKVLKTKMNKRYKLNKFYSAKNKYYRCKNYFYSLRRKNYNLKSIHRTHDNSNYTAYRRYSLWRRPSILISHKNINFKFKNLYTLILNNSPTNFKSRYSYETDYFKFFILNFFFNKISGILNYTKTIIRDITRSFRFFRYNRFVFRKRPYRRKRRKLRYKPWMRRFGRKGRRFFRFFKQRTNWQNLKKHKRKKIIPSFIKIKYNNFKPQPSRYIYRKKSRTVWYTFKPYRINFTYFGFFFDFKHYYRKKKIKKYNYFKRYKNKFIKKITIFRKKILNTALSYTSICLFYRKLFNKTFKHLIKINTTLLYHKPRYFEKKIAKIKLAQPYTGVKYKNDVRAILNPSLLNYQTGLSVQNNKNILLENRTNWKINSFLLINFVYTRLVKCFLFNKNNFYNYFEPSYKMYTPSYLTNYIKIFFDMQFNMRTVLYINFELLHRATPSDTIFLNNIKNNLRTFNYKFSTIFFLNEFLDILFLAFKLRNMDIIIPYINKILKSLIIYQHKIFFDFFFKLIKGSFGPHFSKYGIAGILVKIKGKVGVGGNSRKRWIKLITGVTTNTNFKQDTLTINKLLNTTTGALGFKMVIFYNY